MKYEKDNSLLYKTCRSFLLRRGVTEQQKFSMFFLFILQPRCYIIVIYRSRAYCVVICFDSLLLILLARNMRVNSFLYSPISSCFHCRLRTYKLRSCVHVAINLDLVLTSQFAN